MYQMIFGATPKFNDLYPPNLQGRAYSEKMYLFSLSEFTLQSLVFSHI